MTASEDDDSVWKLVIQNTGAIDRVLHTSLHSSINSGIIKANNVLRYEVPDREEWYVKDKPLVDDKINKTGYVLREIDGWPIRIEVTRKEVLDETGEE